MYFYLKATVRYFYWFNRTNISIVKTFQANNRISYFFPLRYFLSLINFELINLMSMNRKLVVTFWCFLVLVKSYRKKKKFKTGLITLYILLVFA